MSALAVFNYLIVTGGSDSTIKLWLLKGWVYMCAFIFTSLTALLSLGEILTLTQTLDLNGRFALDIKLTVLPGAPNDASLIMAVGATDKLIRIYTSSQGHVCGFVRCITKSTNSYYAASSSLMHCLWMVMRTG